MTQENTVLTGRYQGSGRGFGFLIPDDGSEDCFIPPRRESGAWDGDIVEAALEPADPSEPGRRVAHVTKVVTRGSSTATGTIRKVNREIWLHPDNERLPSPIKLPGKTKVRDSEKAAVEVVSYGSDSLPPLGRLKADFGPAGTREASTAAILYTQNIFREFPAEVLDEAEAIPQEVPAQAIKGRLDLRSETIITIDGTATKDIDDAVSLRREGENWLLGVHIADVSAYVTPGSALDNEAWERGTSVYFADQVVPMLPPALSNGICSLNPGVDRLAMSCIMVLDKTGAVVSHTITASIIRSTERMTYADCNVLLGGEAPQALREELEHRYAHIAPMLRDMAVLSQRLEKLRRDRGALDLDTQESAVVCDSQGRPINIVARQQGKSEKLIESFMLVANETVASHLLDQKWPGVYRVHEKPSAEKAEGLRAMLAPLGLSFREPSGGELQKVLDSVKDTPKAPAVSMMVLRSMMKARYAPENLGHFGLGAEHYCHFTSPIRRYPDLMVHRCLHALLEKQGKKELVIACDSAARQSSLREVAAQTAERDIEKLYLAEYMRSHIGEEFDAAISGVTKFGLFAALSNGVEGLIPVETLPDDHYEYDELRLTLTGVRTGAVYAFGSPLRVVCVSADPGTGRVEFRLPGREEVPSGKAAAAEERPARRNYGRFHRQESFPRNKQPGHGHSRPAMHVPRRGRKGKRR